MITIGIAVLVLVLGALLYKVSKDPELKEMGRIMFFCGLLVCLLTIGGGLGIRLSSDKPRTSTMNNPVARTHPGTTGNPCSAEGALLSRLPDRLRSASMNPASLTPGPLPGAG
jgi:hypothetical protein